MCSAAQLSKLPGRLSAEVALGLTGRCPTSGILLSHLKAFMLGVLMSMHQRLPSMRSKVHKLCDIAGWVRCVAVCDMPSDILWRSQELLMSCRSRVASETCMTHCSGDFHALGSYQVSITSPSTIHIQHNEGPAFMTPLFLNL